MPTSPYPVADPARVRELAAEAIARRLGRPMPEAILSVTADPDPYYAGTVLLHVNSGGNALAVEHGLPAGWAATYVGSDTPGGYGVVLRVSTTLLPAAPPAAPEAVDPIVARWWEFAADPMLTEALVRFVARQVSAGWHPDWKPTEGLRGAARDWLQQTVRKQLADRAALPCQYVDGDPDDWATLAVCDQRRADSGRSLYCPGHTARVAMGDRGVVYGRDAVIEYQCTGVVPTAPADDWRNPVRIPATDPPGSELVVATGQPAGDVDAAVRDALGHLDGTPAASVALLAGVPVDRLADYGGMPADEVAGEPVVLFRAGDNRDSIDITLDRHGAVRLVVGNDGQVASVTLTPDDLVRLSLVADEAAAKEGETVAAWRTPASDLPWWMEEQQ